MATGFGNVPLASRAGPFHVSASRLHGQQLFFDSELDGPDAMRITIASLFDEQDAPYDLRRFAASVLTIVQQSRPKTLFCVKCADGHFQAVVLNTPSTVVLDIETRRESRSSDSADDEETQSCFVFAVSLSCENVGGVRPFLRCLDDGILPQTTTDEAALIVAQALLAEMGAQQPVAPDSARQLCTNLIGQWPGLHRNQIIPHARALADAVRRECASQPAVTLDSAVDEFLFHVERAIDRDASFCAMFCKHMWERLCGFAHAQPFLSFQMHVKSVAAAAK